MARLTRQERSALLLLAFALVAGTLLRWWNAYRAALPPEQQSDIRP